MRADRLLSILMLLQSQGKMSAPQLAKELEVSVRSIYRDIESLSAAGVPIYVERGVNGGCALLEGYRSNLTGLTRNEMKALFMLGIPDSLVKLGVSQDIKSALRKLAVSISDNQLQYEQTVQKHIYIDWTSQYSNSEPIPCLQKILQAISTNRELHISYTEMIGPLLTQFERTINPYGLVAKNNEWYLICTDIRRMHVYRMSRILTVENTGKFFGYPENFDLKAFWESWYSEEFDRLPSYLVVVGISPNLAKMVSRGYEERLFDAISRDKTIETDGSIKTTLVFENLVDARDYILRFGKALEVIEPEHLRLSVIDHAKQTLSLYESSSSFGVPIKS
jgi:predicted DNA-binding transcriptional regulator YafY